MARGSARFTAGTVRRSMSAAKAVRAWIRSQRRNAYLAFLRLRNARSSDPITGSADVVVCLTTHGKRLRNVFYTLESIGRGTVKPRRVILWLDDTSDTAADLITLNRLRERGLEIERTENYGPHTKYYPYVMSIDYHLVPLVTADDDMLYPRDWLESLLAATQANQGSRAREVVCHRARAIEIVGAGLGPYSTWGLVTNATASYLNFATGVGGVLYPPELLDLLRKAGDDFRELCPRADDVWLHAIALRNGYRARQIRPGAYKIALVPFDKDVALWPTNVQDGGNDSAIAATYTPEDIATLIQAQQETGRVQHELAD